ncbi:C40 family peptidase [Streptomyces boncukensis]|uniref:Glycoside hydrolase n=1 Tax=Streptomyces boncukensis TaxID=2711219 RepID=A0A6G4X4M7_9ACTN|nr:C40 family peptidase [Streptomyces boncukensis]NGO72348.1 glycoside hydrolase [Streptomyces boncukensis]
MASHRKQPRTRALATAASARGALGISSAALASLTLLSQSAHASPTDPPDRNSGKPSLAEVQKRVDALYRQAGSATQKYNAAKEATGRQRDKVNRTLDQVAKRTDRLNDARRALGRYAAAQYRTGGVSETATLLLTEDPQQFFTQRHLMNRLTGSQKKAVTDYEKQQRAAGSRRAEATRQLARLSASQKRLKANRSEIRSKLSEARELLSKLTAEEKARLAEIERKKRAEARQKAMERAEAERREQARKERERQRERQRERESDTGDQQDGPDSDTGSDTGSGTGTGSGDTSTPDSSYAAKAAKVLGFAKQQLGKPYVWGATGPNSYDCSGFTQAAWKEGGASLPRTTFDQVKVGTKVARSALRPGDLIFFYDDVSHVGIYTGDGQMIHAPKPGTNIRFESIDTMPFHSAVRPA